MPKESVDQWSQRIAKHGGGRASAYLEEFEGDDDDFDEEEDETEEELAYRQQEAARKKRILAEQAEIKRALDERQRKLDDAQLAEQQDWAATLRGLVDDQIYTKNVLIKQMFGAPELTPVGDAYFDYRPALLTPESFALAKEEIAAEAQRLVAKFALARQEKAKRTERQLLALDVKGVVDRRDELVELARGLGLDLSGRPAYPDPASLTSDAAIADQRRLAGEEAAELKLRLDLLAARSWAPGDLLDLDAPVLLARDQLVLALAARGALPGEAKTWVKTLNAHAKQRADEANEAEMLDALAVYLEAHPLGPTGRLVKDKVIAFAEECGYDPDLWREYQKAWKANRAAPADPPRDGVLPLTQLNAMRGETAGQRYTAEESFKEGATRVYSYHLSVSFSIRGKTGLADISDMHVSFKSGSLDRKFWYSVAKGKVSYRETSGGAIKDSVMHGRARALMLKKSRTLRFQVVTP